MKCYKALWLNQWGQALPPGTVAPTFIASDFDEVGAWLGRQPAPIGA
ncbi:MAG: hypothetical protein ACUVWR_02140 [Anaerolineae bacterium]